MEHRLAERIYTIKPSATLAIDAKAKKMQAEGGDVINLGVGEPDFDTPEFIKNAAIKAIHDGKTKYTPVAGIIELRKAICQKLENDNKLHYVPDEIITCNGAKQAIYNLVQVLINPGDEVIIPAPYWVSYPEIVAITEGKPVIINTDSSQNFKISANDLKAAITPKTKLFILNSPSNPTGMAYSPEELRKLGEVLLEYPDIYILTDDIYEHIMWASFGFTNILNVCPKLKDRTIIINGVSKTYAMTGWRIGYAAGRKDIIAAMVKVQSQSTSNPNSIAQYAAIAALTGNQQCVKDMAHIFKERHDLVIDKLADIPGILCHPNDGTFYAFPDCNQLIAESEHFNDDLELADYLLTKAGVAVVPGSAFGAPGCLRMSYTVSMEQLNDAMNRMRTLFE